MKIAAKLIPATFVKRDNRFRVTVRVEGHRVWAHLPNSGRLRELLVPGQRVLLAAAQAPGRLTSYDLLMVDLDGTLVSVDARLPSGLLYEALRQAQDKALRLGRLEEFAGYAEVQREVTYGQSRLDLVLEGGPDGGRCFIEAKSATLVEDGVALFPDAPTQRGRRHLGELVQARAEGHRAAVVFVVQRDDATSFSPHDEADPAFGQALREAAQAGVEVYAYKCRVNEEEVTFDAPLPVAGPPTSQKSPCTPSSPCEGAFFLPKAGVKVCYLTGKVLKALTFGWLCNIIAVGLIHIHHRCSHRRQ